MLQTKIHSNALYPGPAGELTALPRSLLDFEEGEQKEFRDGRTWEWERERETGWVRGERGGKGGTIVNATKFWSKSTPLALNDS